MMDYDWQTKAVDRKVKRIMQVCNDSKHFPLQVIGIAVANSEGGEGAMYLYPGDLQGIEWADVLKDALSDMAEEYDVAVRSIYAKWHEQEGK